MQRPTTASKEAVTIALTQAVTTAPTVAVTTAPTVAVTTASTLAVTTAPDVVWVSLAAGLRKNQRRRTTYLTYALAV